jgi:hypothetical protein
MWKYVDAIYPPHPSQVIVCYTPDVAPQIDTMCLCRRR